MMLRISAELLGPRMLMHRGGERLLVLNTRSKGNSARIPVRAEDSLGQIRELLIPRRDMVPVVWP